MEINCAGCIAKIDVVNYIDLEDCGWIKIGEWPNYQFVCASCKTQPFEVVSDKIEGKDWFDKYEHCPKCCLFVSMGNDDIDGYLGCNKTQTIDYKIESCPLSERLYKELNE